MLAYYAQPPSSMQASAHYQHFPPASSPSSSPISFPSFDPSHPDVGSYLDAFDFSTTDSAPLMASLATQQPPIRVQQSTPPATTGRRVESSFHSTNKMIRTANNAASAAWDQNGVGLLSPVHFQQQPQQASTLRQGHKRASSNGSSVTSAVSASPLDRTASSYSIAAQADPAVYSSAHDLLARYSAPPHDLSKFPPTPDTPSSQDTCFLPSNNFYTGPQDVDALAQQMAMRRTLDHAPLDDDAGSYQHSMAPSVSSLSHNSPRTPMTGLPDDFNDDPKSLHADYNAQGHNLKIYQDDTFYNPDSPIQAPQSKPRTSVQNLLKSFHQRNMLNDRYQLAQQGHISRSQSPATSASGEVSPFRQTSLYNPQPNQPYSTQRSPQSRVQTASQLREEQKAQADAMELAQHRPRHETQAKTISPKDAVYEYHQTSEEAAMPLFPPEQATQQYGPQFATPLTLQPSQPFQNQSGVYTTLSTPQRDSPAFSPTYGYVPSQPTSNYGFSNALLRSESSMQASPAPTADFPTHMQSMESSLSDVQAAIEVQRPADTSSDAGTYSCTYHGCAHRFETAAKLQKHKREVHRQTTPSGMTAPSARSSQAGPHKCMRINPSTGKPCNSEFSRPYDLTRHEDTIHNSKKIKVKCAFCTEDKTFSRADALTRHMRVVHPEIDYPGKTRRKNARD